jgi:hypothetical protein
LHSARLALEVFLFLARDTRQSFRPVKQSIVTLTWKESSLLKSGSPSPKKPASKIAPHHARRTDYDKLMCGRLAILDQHGLKLSDIQNVIGTLKPLEGGREFSMNFAPSCKSSFSPTPSNSLPPR